MIKTKEWAESHGILTEDILAPVKDYDEPYKRTAREIAVRTVIIHAAVAAAYGIERQNIIEWLKDQNLWSEVSPDEQAFLFSNKPRRLSEGDRINAQWLQEAQWTLLWTIKKVESLGLPTKTCDTIKIVDDIMPVLGDKIEPFISSAELRPIPELRAEDERINMLYHHVQQASLRDEIPDDLIFGVLSQRKYAFEWLRSGNNWDDVNIDT
jgi:hypothetical protein